MLTITRALEGELGDFAASAFSQHCRLTNARWLCTTRSTSAAASCPPPPPPCDVPPLGPEGPPTSPPRPVKLVLSGAAGPPAFVLSGVVPLLPFAPLPPLVTAAETSMGPI